MSPWHSRWVMGWPFSLKILAPVPPFWVPFIFPLLPPQIPVFFVITKVDIAPEHILKQTVQVW